MASRAARGAGTALGATVLFVPAAEAGTFEVTNLDDDGAGSLRAAVEAANTADGADAIVFQAGLSGAIELEDHSPDPTALAIRYGGLEIQGPGADRLAIDARGLDRIFYASDFDQAGERVSISGLTLTGGDTGAAGGAIYSGPAGGLAPELVISDSVIVGNHADGSGGGVWAEGGALEIRGSTFASNTATNDGGGVAIAEQPGGATIQNSTISGNGAGEQGGGVWSDNPGDTRRLVANSTILANAAEEGGGIWANLYDEGSSGNEVFELSSTIVARNAATEEPDLGDDDTVDPADLGRFSLGFSLVERPSDVPGIENPTGSNVLGVDPVLDPLAGNGGPTPTHLPQPLSPALEAAVANGLATDQRGLPRTVDLSAIGSRPGSDGTDIGAVELAEPEATINCQGTELPLRSGTEGDDELTGSAGADAIFGLGGRDVIAGLGGADCLNGGGGKDLLRGGGGGDQLKGRAGKDRLKGQAGKDRLRGQGGKDLLVGGAGRDRMAGGAGRDKLKGGPGRDKLKGNSARDRIVGGGGRDEINCGGGRDRAVAGVNDKVSRNCERVIEVA
jgi:Ca2+-binding RTX toxin-like protein